MIQSAECIYHDNYKIGSFYDRSTTYVPGSYIIEPSWSPEQRRLLKNLPYASRGYVFRDKKLQRYFRQFWWYMPDPSWKADTSDFTPREWRLINKGE